MSNRTQSLSVLQAGNPPATPGVPHSDVLGDASREVSPHLEFSAAPVPATSLPASSAPSAALPTTPEGSLPSTAAPAIASVPLSPPPIPSSLDRESLESANAVTAKVPISFEPFGSEVLKSLHEFGLGGSAVPSSALPAAFQTPAAPDYYFLPKL